MKKLPRQGGQESASELIDWVRDARAMTCALVEDLSDDQLIGPKLATINPLVWEIGHAAYFQEYWVLRHAAKREPIRAEADQLYDSISIDHDVRWDLPMFSRDEVMNYIHSVCDHVCELLSTTEISDELRYFVKLSVFHEDMHTEAFTYTRQTLEYPRPKISLQKRNGSSNQINGDTAVPNTTWFLGASFDEPFVFDNEKWAHPVVVAPFSISKTAVTQGEFAAFVDDDGYDQRELWCDEGWTWRQQECAVAPLYWRRESSGDWSRRVFDEWHPIGERQAMIHVNWFEAQAFCNWAGRRLPTEVEWEIAAAAPAKETYPWGEQKIRPEHANMDWQLGDVANVDDFAASDSFFKCRQMIGNVWEWTATTFEPFPGFVADPYDQYSQPCFGQCKVLRGGCWVTRSRLIRNTWRNFYQPDRRDVWCGFRTCAIDVS